MNVIGIALVFISFQQAYECTRIPLEVYDPPAGTRVRDNNNVHQIALNSHSEQRRSRQMTEKTPRILYQVGNSEGDLPICAPNAVCSKIDLYETPWIERQCRCPDNQLQQQQPHIIYHHKDKKLNDRKYQQYYDDEKRLQQKRLLDLDQGSDHFKDENKHIKDILKKLGTIYNTEDIIMDEKEDHDQQLYLHKNLLKKDPLYSVDNAVEFHGVKKFRHSAHRMDFPTIGGCSSLIGSDDGHTISDKTRHYKLCEPVHKLPTCRYFRDYTWTLKSSPEANATEQIVHCRCPKNSITYLIKREPIQSGKLGYIYLFACSPQSRLRCLRKEPCKLFTVRKRQEFLDEVNTNPLCQCPRGHSCPKHHTDSGVIAGKSYIEDNIRTYSGYCLADS